MQQRTYLLLVCEAKSALADLGLCDKYGSPRANGFDAESPEFVPKAYLYTSRGRIRG